LKGSGRNIKLTSYDDLFSTEESRTDAQREKVMEIPLSELHPFRNHPFKVLDDEKMQDTAESIREYGVLVPAIARPREEGGYELIAGHRRKRGCELAGLETMPVIVRNLDDDAATLVMVDSYIQRENILPSERAFAYRMKLEAMKRQGARNDLTSGQVGPKSETKRSILLFRMDGDIVLADVQIAYFMNRYPHQLARNLQRQHSLVFLNPVRRTGKYLLQLFLFHRLHEIMKRRDVVYRLLISHSALPCDEPAPENTQPDQESRS